MKIIEHAKQIITIDNFWSEKECEEYIAKSESIGYEAAKISTEKGDKVVESVRNNHRVLHKDIDLANLIWEKLKNVAPKAIGNAKAIGLNELFRFYKYQAGQRFKKHRDESFIRNESEASYYTFMIYLNDNFTGGDTTFNELSIKPKTGSALIFLHNLEHSGSEIEKGIKYVLRTDIMYKVTIE